jgi:hypothetical protein
LVTLTNGKIKYRWSLKKQYRRCGPKKIKDRRNDENYSMRQTGGYSFLTSALVEVRGQP